MKRNLKSGPQTVQCGVRRSQGGVILIEVLVSILIFALGILGIIGLYAVTAKTSVDAAIRADAAQLADDVIALMQVSDFKTLTADFVSPGAKTSTFKSGRVDPLLPSAEFTVTIANVDSVAAVSSVAASGGSGKLVTVTAKWLTPGRDGTSIKSQHISRTAINNPTNDL